MPTQMKELNSKWRYYEGTTSAKTILADLAKVMCLGVKDKNGEVIVERNWDIEYPLVNTDATGYEAPVDINNLSPKEFTAKINNQLEQITNRVILRTTTDAQIDVEKQIDDLDVEDDLNVEHLTEYVEFYKPEYLVNPEKYSPETERIGILPITKIYNEQNLDTDDYIATEFKNGLVFNNHYILIRVFDNIVKTYNKYGKVIDINPLEEVRDEFTNNIIETKCHISEWAKLSWYQDFSEISRDLNDADPGTDNMLDGIEFVALNTPGLNSETRFRFYMNTNNNRTVIVLKGNESIEFTKNNMSKHLISFAYIGRIKSMEGSINDTIGNFALTTSSSTEPCSTNQKIMSTRYTDINDEESFIDNKIQEAKNAVGISDGTKIRYTLNLLYSYDPNTFEVVLNLKNGTRSILNKKMYTVNKNILEFVNPPEEGAIIRCRAVFKIPTVNTINGVIRDDFGNVVKIIKPNKYGQNTATCVTDIGMNNTRSKAYWQTHKIMFNTTEEYMSKENFGKSAYTDEYYGDEIKVVHPNDGLRGKLESILITDKSSLYTLDELVENRDFNKKPNDIESTYKYFLITADYSFLASGPNSQSGIGLLTNIRYPDPKDTDEALQRVYDDLYIGRISLVTSNISLPVKSLYSSKISWESDNSKFINITNNTPTDGGSDYITAIVVRPEQEEENEKVKLTATISIDDKSIKKEFNCTVIKKGITELQAVTKDKSWLDLAKENELENSASDAEIPILENVKTDLILPVLGEYGSLIQWTIDDDSKDKDSIEIKEGNQFPNGIITRPSPGGEIKEVTLIAQIIKGNEKENKKFIIKIMPWTYAEIISAQSDAMTFESIANGNKDANSIETDLLLETEGFMGTKIDWISSLPEYISNTGKVNRPPYSKENQSVILTAQILRGDNTEEDKKLKLFELLVLKAKQTNEEMLEEFTLLLEIKDYLSDIDKQNFLTKGIVDNIALPKGYGEKGISISWKSSNEEIISNEGYLKPSQERVLITLTAKISINNEEDTKTKEFQVWVAQKNETNKGE